jgi:hypothetical protein
MFERLAYFNLNFFAGICKELREFQIHYFYKSQIFDKQLGELPYEQ